MCARTELAAEASPAPAGTKRTQPNETPNSTQITETQAAQIQLDRAAEDFRRLHGERKHLIAQWDEAAAAMRRRDEAIRAAGAAFAERRAALRRRAAELDAQAGFLEAEVAANRELEARVAHYEKEVVRGGRAAGARRSAGAAGRSVPGRGPERAS
jgi:chromosome segregation ATPase